MECPNLCFYTHTKEGKIYIIINKRTTNKQTKKNNLLHLWISHLIRRTGLYFLLWLTKCNMHLYFQIQITYLSKYFNLLDSKLLHSFLLKVVNDVPFSVWASVPARGYEDFSSPEWNPALIWVQLFQAWMTLEIICCTEKRKRKKPST